MPPTHRPGRLPPPSRAVARLVLVCLVATWAAGCHIKKPDPVPDVPVATPEAFTATGDDVVGERWWLQFEDERLDAYVEQALAGNLDLASLWHRIAEARAIFRREASAFWPEIEAGGTGELGNRGGVDTSSLELGVAAAYEIDLFDRIQAATDAERGRLQVRIADYRAGAITLAAEVTETYFQLREAELQLALLDEQIASNEQIRELIGARVATQQLRGVDLLRQRELIESTREQRIVVEAQRRLLENQLAILLGVAPGLGWDPPPPTDADLPPLAPPPATGVPIDLVRRRPDIVSARYAVCAANKDLQVALNACYPRLNLGASVSTLESASNDIFRQWLGSFAAGLFAPLFDGGLRRAEMARTEAVRDRLLADYGQTVLVAFREVEDALVREASQRDRVASLVKQAKLSEETTERLRTDYFNGVGNYIDVLAALTQKQQLERDILTNRRLLLDARVALYRALAGSFETPRERQQG